MLYPHLLHTEAWVPESDTEGLVFSDSLTSHHSQGNLFLEPDSLFLILARN